MRDLDFQQPDFVEKAYEHWEWFRNNQPIFFSKALGGWLFTKYEDVFELIEHRLVTSENEPYLANKEPLVAEYFRQTLLFTDGDRHE